MYNQSLITSDEHHAYRENFFVVSVWRNVAETNARQATEREVESGDVFIAG